MGACGSGILQKLGPNFAKLVACQKGKDFINQRIGQFKNNMFNYSDEAKNQTMALINNQQAQLLAKVQQEVKNIDKQNPDVLDKAAALQRKTKLDLLGATEIKNKFSEARTQAKNKFQQQEKKFLDEIDNQANNLKQNLDNKRPKIPIYDQLPENQKKKALQEGQKKFADQIKIQQDQLKKQLESKLDINKYRNLFKTNHAQDLENVKKKSEQIILTARQGLSSTSLFC